MPQHTRESAVADGLSSAILHLVEQPERIGDLRQFLSGFTHRCRNSLHAIKMSLYLCRRGIEGPVPSTWVDLERTYQEAERLLNRLHEIYRPMGTVKIRSTLGQFLGERLPSWRNWFTERGLVLAAEPPAEEALGDYDPMHLGSGLDAFIAWRLDQGIFWGNARLAWRANLGFFELDWNEADRQLTAGVESRCYPRSGRSGGSRAGDSLALPLLARVATAHGGRVLFRNDPAFHLRVTWPQFQADAKLR